MLGGSSRKMKNFPSTLSNEKRSKEPKKQTVYVTEQAERQKKYKEKYKKNRESKGFLRMCSHLLNKSLTH